MFNQLILAFNMFFICCMATSNIFLLASVKKAFFRRIYTWIDLLFMFLNMNIYIIYFSDSENETDEEFKRGMKNTRYMMVFGTLLIFLKFCYFFQIIDAIAPLFDIIIKIAIDIKYFILVLSMYIFALSTALFYIG